MSHSFSCCRDDGRDGCPHVPLRGCRCTLLRRHSPTSLNQADTLKILVHERVRRYYSTLPTKIATETYSRYSPLFTMAEEICEVVRTTSRPSVRLPTSRVQGGKDSFLQGESRGEILRRANGARLSGFWSGQQQFSEG